MKALGCSTVAVRNDILLVAKKAKSEMGYWEVVLRNMVRSLMGPGWSMGPTKKGRTYLMHRQTGGRDVNTKAVQVTLPYAWNEDNVEPITARVRFIYQRMRKEDIGLKEAAVVANAASSKTVEDWSDALQKFEHHKRTFGKVRIGDVTWNEKYVPYLKVLLLEVRKQGRATTGLEAVERVAAHWEPGSVSRKHAAQCCSRFLNFCVERLQFKKTWTPPAKLTDIVSNGKNSPEKRVGYPMTDDEVVALVDSFSNKQHQFAIQLMAVYGLRPEDLRYLEIKDGELWSMYRKPGGGGVTNPRPLHPLHVKGIDWKLKQRLMEGEPLPPLGTPGKASERIINILRRNSVWQEIKADVTARGHQLVSYSLRHRYVKQGQMRGIPPKVLADALGHSLESHLRAYSKWTDMKETAQFFD